MRIKVSITFLAFLFSFISGINQLAAQTLSSGETVDAIAASLSRGEMVAVSVVPADATLLKPLLIRYEATAASLGRVAVQFQPPVGSLVLGPVILLGVSKKEADVGSSAGSGCVQVFETASDLLAELGETTSCSWTMDEGIDFCGGALYCDIGLDFVDWFT